MEAPKVAKMVYLLDISMLGSMFDRIVMILQYELLMKPSLWCLRLGKKHCTGPVSRTRSKPEGAASVATAMPRIRTESGTADGV